MDYPKTYMVTATDLGAGVHPVLKSSYGQRASHVAVNAVYGGKSNGNLLFSSIDYYYI